MKDTVFKLCYLMLFCIGGAVAYTGHIPFRMAYMSIMPIALIPFYGIRLDRVVQAFIVFFLVILLSGLYNGSSLRQVLSFLRFIITPFAMYYIVRIGVNQHNVRKIIKFSMLLGYIQLPVILLQRIFYDQLVGLSYRDIPRIDFNVGTFYLQDDPALSFFLLGLIIFLLFDSKNNYFIKNRALKAGIFSLTILLANSVISQIMMLGVWAYYILRFFNIKTVVRLTIVSTLALATFLYFNWHQDWLNLMGRAIDLITFSNIEDMDVFMEGSYARTAAVLYYLNQPLALLGDGPSRYFDPVTGVYLLGNRGLLFTYYSEIGLVGFFAGLWVLYRMMKYQPGRSEAIAKLYFLILLGLSITTSVVSDASIMLAYNLFLTTGYIHQKRMLHDPN